MSLGVWPATPEEGYAFQLEHVPQPPVRLGQRAVHGSFASEWGPILIVGALGVAFVGLVILPYLQHEGVTDAGGCASCSSPSPPGTYDAEMGVWVTG